MANQPAFRTMMVDLSFSEQAANEIWDNQGVNSIAIMAELSDADVGDLMRTTRKPGGGGNGFAVPFVAERRFKDACQMSKHYIQTQRTLTFAVVRTAVLPPFGTQRRLEDEYSARASPDPPKIDFTDHPKALETIQQFLGQHRGASGVTLSYVMRQRLVPPPAADDPAASYLTLDSEREARAPIIAVGAVDPSEEDGPWDPMFLVDDGQAYQLVVGLFQGNRAVWTHLKKHRTRKSGRFLVRAYVQHFLGPRRCDAEVKAIIKELQSIVYHGRVRGFTLEKALTKHVDLHGRLSSLEEYGYGGLDQGLKVAYLTDGIKANHLQVVTTQILASPALRVNFEDCADLYREYERVAGDRTLDARNVSGVGTEGCDEIEDRFYTDDEYTKMSKKQKQRLRELREENRGGDGGDGGRGKSGNGKSASSTQLARLQRKVGNQKRELKALKAKRADERNTGSGDDEASDAEEEASTGGSNRSNSALQRRSGRGRGGGRR